MRVNIDPIIWHTIRNQVAVIWVQSLPPAPAPEPAPTPAPTPTPLPARSSHQAQAGHVETDATFTIYVQSRWGKTIQLEVHRRDSIRRVKRLLERRNIVKATQSPLYFGRILLEDDRSVGYYSIANGATLSFLCGPPQIV
jgi:hypothetical protein